jgi:hypothetical protein
MHIQVESCVVVVLDDGPEEAHVDCFIFAKLFDVQSEIERVHLDTEHGTSMEQAWNKHGSIDPSPEKYDLMRVWLTNLSPPMLPESLQVKDFLLTSS